MEETNGIEKNSRYSTDVLLQAVARLTDADSFVHGLEALISNYNLLGDKDALVITWCDPEEGVVEEAFATGYAAALFPSGLTRPLENTGVAFFQKRGGAAIQCSEMSLEIEGGNIDFSMYRNASVESVVGAPINWRLRTIGIIQLLRLEPSTPIHLEFVEHLSTLLAPHLALIRSTRVETAMRDQFSALSDLAGMVSSGSDLKQVLDNTARHAGRFVGFDALVIRIRDQRSGNTHAYHQQGVIDLSLLPGAGDRVSARLIEIAESSGRPLCVPISGPGERYPDDTVLEQFLEHVPSILIAPLRDSNGFLGTIECYSLNEWAFDADDIDSIRQLADLLLHGIAQFNLIDAMSQQINVRATMAELARIAATGTNPKNVLANICVELSNILTFSHVTFYLPDMLVSTFDGLDTSIGMPSFSAIPYSTVENLDIEEIESHAAHMMMKDLPVFTTAVELWPRDDSGGAFIAVVRDSLLREQEAVLLQEAARHIAPAVKSLILHIRDIQLVEQQHRADKAESSALHFQEVNEMKREVLSTVTHELRTPLTSIAAFVDILSRNQPGNLTSGQLQNLEVVKRSALAITNIVNDLDDLSSIEQSCVSLFCHEADLSQLVRDLVKDIRPLLQPTAHKLRLTLPRRKVLGVIDRDRLVQVLSNLVDNAVKYSPVESIIRILLRVNSGHAHFFVRDQGDGIPIEEQGNLFELFTRAGTQRAGSVRGTGIGLHVCKKIVEAHGGQISLHSIVGEGTTVHFWVPLEQVDEISKH